MDSKLDCVSASNAQIRFMISVGAGVQIVLTVNNSLKLFSSPFGSFSLYLKVLFLQEN